MFKKIKLLFYIFLLLNFTNLVLSNENFFEQGKRKYNEKKLEESKFLFQRSILFNPKNSKSYLYLAKIYNAEQNLKEEEKNLKTTLLIDPNNEEATYMIIKIKLKRSNYSEVKELTKTFLKICKTLCEKEKSILESLKNLEPKNES
jgi:tetratricopeptide (TPR) repeat protein